MWVENPPLVVVQRPAVACAETAHVFYPLVALPPPRRVTAIRLMISALTAGAATLAATRRTASHLLTGGGRICSVAARYAAMSLRKFDRATAAISSFGRAIATPAFIVGRAVAVIVPCLVIYAAFAITPATERASSDETETDQAPDEPETSAATGTATTIGLAAVPPEPEIPLSAPANVRIVDAPPLDAACDEQTWPYVTQRCLAAKSGEIDLTSDPGVAALNAEREAITSANARADDIGRDILEETVSTPVKKRTPRHKRKRHR